MQFSLLPRLSTYVTFVEQCQHDYKSTEFYTNIEEGSITQLGPEESFADRVLCDISEKGFSIGKILKFK